MGYYVNPPNETKESFLKREGIEISPRDVRWEDIPVGCFPVVWLHNGLFTAAGVAYSKRELEAFLHPDGRPKKVYIVEIEKLRKVSDIDVYFSNQ